MLIELVCVQDLLFCFWPPFLMLLFSVFTETRCAPGAAAAAVDVGQVSGCLTLSSPMARATAVMAGMSTEYRLTRPKAACRTAAATDVDRDPVYMSK